MTDGIDLEELRRATNLLKDVRYEMRALIPRFDLLERRVGGVEERLSEAETLLRATRDDLERLDRRLDPVFAELGGLRDRMDGLGARMDRMEGLLVQILDRLPPR